MYISGKNFQPVLYYTYHQEQQQQTGEETQQFQKHCYTRNTMEKVNVYFCMVQMNLVGHVFHKVTTTLCTPHTWLTSEFLTEWNNNRSRLHKTGFSNGLQIFQVRNPVMVNEVIVFFGSCKCTVDFVNQIFNIYILIIARCHRFDQICCMLKKFKIQLK